MFKIKPFDPRSFMRAKNTANELFKYLSTLMVADSSDAYSQNAENKYITRYFNSLSINLFVCLGVWHHRLANGAHRLKPRHGCLLLVLEAVPSLLIQNVCECNIQIVFDQECIYLMSVKYLF